MLNILLKLLHHVVEVMFLLMVLLFVLKVAQSGAHHMSTGGHALHALPLFFWGWRGGTSYQVIKNEYVTITQMKRLRDKEYVTTSAI